MFKVHKYVITISHHHGVGFIDIITFITSTLNDQIIGRNMDLYHVNIHITSKQLGCLSLGLLSNRLLVDELIGVNTSAICSFVAM